MLFMCLFDPSPLLSVLHTRLDLQLYDVKQDDKVTLDEVEEITRAVYALLGYYVTPPYDKKTSDDRAKELFSKLDPYNKSFVTREDFINICSRVCNSSYSSPAVSPHSLSETRGSCDKKPTSSQRSIETQTQRPFQFSASGEKMQ